MTRDDLFNTNASIVRDLADACAEVCPEAMLGIITNPVSNLINSVVVLLTDFFSDKQCYNTNIVINFNCQRLLLILLV